MFHVKQPRYGRSASSLPLAAQIAALEECLRKLGVSFDQEQARLLLAYSEMVREWNRRLNLIARGDEAIFVQRHVGESLAFTVGRDLPRGAQVLDLGSGAGLPGVPIKILRQDLHMVLVDSQRRKALFLQEVIESLGMSGVEAVCARAERLGGDPEWQGRFQCVVARAVAPLGRLWRWAMPLLAHDGQLVTLKGGNINGELLQLAGDDPAAVVDVHTPPACLVAPGTGRVLITIHRGATT